MMKKILAVVGLGTVVGALYGKHVYDTLKTDIMYKLYNGEELDEQEKEFMEKSSEFRKAYKELKERNNKADKADEAGKTVDNIAQEANRQAEETFRQQQQVAEEANRQAVEQVQQQM